MQCACPTTALRIFIRSVARLHLDPVLRHPASPRLLRTSRQFSQSTHREATSVPESSSEEGATLDRSTLRGTKAVEKPAKWSTTTSTPGSDASRLHQPGKGRAWPRGDRTKEEIDGEFQSAQDYSEGASNLVSLHAAVLEITPESIEALAAESLEDYARQQPERTDRGVVSRTSFRSDVSTASRQSRRDLKPGDRRRPRPETAEDGNAFPPKETWQIQKAALKEKFARGWSPRKRLSPDALRGIRAIHAQYPLVYTTAVLAEKFEVSAEAIRRILKSKWTPKEDEEADRTRRWHARGTKVWSRWADMGMKPPARWRSVGVGRGENRGGGLEQHSRESNNFRDRQAVAPVGGRRRPKALMDLTTEPAHRAYDS